MNLILQDNISFCRIISNKSTKNVYHEKCHNIRIMLYIKKTNYTKEVIFSLTGS